MILKQPVLRIDLTASAEPTLPGVGGLVPIGVRYVEHFSNPDPEGMAMWGLDITNITAANTPVVNFATGAVTADSAVVVGNVLADFEGRPLDIDVLKVLVLTVTGAPITATVAGTGLLARLPVGTHVFRGTLTEWRAGVTFAAPTGTAGLAFTAFSTAP